MYFQKWIKRLFPFKVCFPAHGPSLWYSQQPVQSFAGKQNKTHTQKNHKQTNKNNKEIHQTPIEVWVAPSICRTAKGQRYSKSS